MAHPGYVTSIVVDSVDLTRSDGRLLFRITRGLNEVPEVRGQDVVVPGRSGRIARNRKLDRLPIEATGMVMASGASESLRLADFRSLVETLRDLMNPVQDPYEIVATVEDGTTRTITARPQNIVWGDDTIPGYQTASLAWESVDAADWGVAGS
jgi:hypothetical protein